SILAPLTISTGTLFHPRFGTSEGEVNAGTAFAAKLTGKSQILIVSALHLFGPAGGLKTNIQADKLTTAWKKLVVEDCKSQNYFGEIQMQPINLSGARPHPQKSAIGDIAACTVTDATAIKALPLSQRIPSNGERVWLVSKLPGSRELLHPATVERLDDGWLLYSFPDRSINLQSTSGAPIIDHKGQVVAVNASNAIKDGKTIGYGTPVVNFYPTLAALVQ
ncbi:serine protease, partial [Rhodopirellula sp.]|nr:serine protease [Rhodopirellula sp.]